MAKKWGGRWAHVGADRRGQGGQAQVYEVIDDEGEFEGRHALKRLKNLKSAGRLERFRREADILQGLQHPNVVRLLDVELETAEPFIVMELHPASFAECAGDLQRKTIGERLGLFEGVCRGVAAAHAKGVVHRDIKPENVLLGADGRAVVADFGLAYVAQEERYTESGEAVGARYFMAPELEDGRAQDVTPAADVYSLGKLLYWLMSGGEIFNREQHRAPTYDLAHERLDMFTRMQMEHINLLLDDLIVLDVANRHPVVYDMPEEVRTVRGLIEGGYAPRSAHVPHACRYCGRGTYRFDLDGTGAHVENYGLKPSSPLWYALKCDYCGHVEFFRPNNDRWWGPRYPYSK